MKISSVYGTAPEGEHPAILTGSETTKYPKGLRRIFGYLVLKPDQSAPLLDANGEPYYAVAVCNASEGKSPKSKPYKICKAMLQAREYNQIDAALGVPDPEHFLEKNKDGTNRIIWIRVEQRQSGDTAHSLVTHIRRPRDEVWECIEGEFDKRSIEDRPSVEDEEKRADKLFAELGGDKVLADLGDGMGLGKVAVGPSWLNADGTYRPLTPDEQERLPGEERWSI